MTHIQKDYELKIYIPREFSDNQNVVIVGERHTVKIMQSHQSWKLIQKLTDEEVDEMILETDVDETHCFQQLADVPGPRIAERIVEVVTAFHRSESQNESWHRSSTWP